MAYNPPTIEQIFGHEEIQKAIWDCEGDMKAVSIKLGCALSALYNYIDIHPEAADLRKKAKLFARKAKLEDYEKVLDERINQKKSLSTSFAAIRYYLEAHGKEEGWGQDSSLDEASLKERELQEDFKETFRILREERASSKASKDSNSHNE